MRDEPEPTFGAWRSGRRMVMRTDAELPDRCVKTNAPAEGAWADIRLSWHHPAYYALLLIGLIVYFIVAPFVSTAVTVRVGITDRALSASRRARVISVALFVCGVGLWVAAAVVVLAPLFYAGAVLLVAAFPPYLLRGRLIWATRVQGGYVWVAGVHPGYLAALPEWKG